MASELRGSPIMGESSKYLRVKADEGITPFFPSVCLLVYGTSLFVWPTYYSFLSLCIVCHLHSSCSLSLVTSLPVILLLFIFCHYNFFSFLPFFCFSPSLPFSPLPFSTQFFRVLSSSTCSFSQ